MRCISLAVALLTGGTTCRPSRTEHQRALLEKYAAYLNSGQTDGIEAVLHPGYELRYAPDFKPSVKGIEAFRQDTRDPRILQIRDFP